MCVLITSCWWIKVTQDSRGWTGNRIRWVTLSCVHRTPFLKSFREVSQRNLPDKLVKGITLHSFPILTMSCTLARKKHSWSVKWKHVNTWVCFNPEALKALFFNSVGFKTKGNVSPLPGIICKWKPKDRRSLSICNKLFWKPDPFVRLGSIVFLLYPFCFYTYICNASYHSKHKGKFFKKMNTPPPAPPPYGSAVFSFINHIPLPVIAKMTNI